MPISQQPNQDDLSIEALRTRLNNVQSQGFDDQIESFESVLSELNALLEPPHKA